MNSRSAKRRLAVQAIFSLDFGERKPEETLAHFSDELSQEPLNGFTQKLIRGVLESIESIDGVLKKASRKWRFSRLGAVERAILRAAVYEMMSLDTPKAVVINEAVELAKEFGDKETSSLVNAILDTVANEREAVKGNKGER
ncbi:MAG: transcription antitermination factor NusB [Myxococcota bacterium]